VLTIDGSSGEGGGQVLRTSLTLAAALGCDVRIANVRAGRPRPGLAAQHLTAARAIAAVCGGVLVGDRLGSTELVLRPGGPVRAGHHAFDVALAREGGSAGSATLVLQAVLLLLARAPGASSVVVRGGTHVPFAPPLDHLRDVWLPFLADAGCAPRVDERRTGWHPAGGGEVRVELRGPARFAPFPARLAPFPRSAGAGRGELVRVHGRALAAELPAHVAQRMTDRARALLGRAGIHARVEPELVHADCPGAGLFLCAEYAGARAGFGALGRPGKSSESVAEDAVRALLDHRASGAHFERHTGDQALLHLAFAPGPSEYTVEALTSHLTTNARLFERFGLAEVHVEPCGALGARVRVTPRARAG
jgi:RNA 3'-terminal phosphate cyclase (ATP)